MNGHEVETVENRIKRLRDEMDFGSTLFDGLIGHAVIAADFDGNVLVYNEGARQIFGYAPEEVCGQRKIEDFFPVDVVASGRLGEVIAGLTASGQSSFAGEKVRKGGERFPALAQFALTRDKAGKAIGFVEVVQDLSERRRVEEDLRSAREAAEAASRAKSEFLANMSHEIRTPMNGIIGMTELALDTELTPEQRQYLDLVYFSAEALLAVIDDILDFSKIEAGQLDLEAIDFHLRDCLGETIRSLAHRAHKKGLELTCELAADLPDSLIGDPARLRQVVVNLVGNAIKFTEHGGVSVRVDAEREENDAVGLHVAVSDTGIGIPAEKQAKIFGAFNQVDSSSTRKYGGTGLGLTIAARLVTMMGGRIWLESSANHGSTFHFSARLPISERAVPRGTAAPDPACLQGLAVLAVDDNETNRRIFEEVLARWQMKAKVVASGQAALDELALAADAGEPYALVLSDALMPEMDGFTLFDQIKGRPNLAGTRFIIASSADQQRDTSNWRERGIDAYLLKPVKQSELLSSILSVVGPPAVKDASAGRGQAEHVPTPARGLKVLLVEDNLVNQTLGVILLEKQGHSVVVAGNGLLGLEALERQPFDLVLMDVQMPEMDGFETTSRIRAQERATGKHQPIIALTAHAMKGDRERCLAAGMDEYVSKPIQSADLFRAIVRLVPDAALAEPDAPVAPADAVDPRRAVLLKRFGGKVENLKRIMQAFQGEAAKSMAEIEAAIASNEPAQMRRAAHSLKGAVGLFGVVAATEAALKLEAMGHAGDLTEAQPVFSALQKEIEAIQALASELVQSS